MKIIVAPDSFKGSLSARDAAEAMAAGARDARPDADVQLFPLADGGEGTVDALVSVVPGSRKVHCRVMGPLGDPVRAYYGLLGAEGTTAVVEMAAASGLTLVPENQRDPREASTYGTGELIDYAAGEPGVERLIIGLGGSATNDAGAGALQALGVCFFDRAGSEIATPIRAKDLPRIARVDWRRAPLLPDALGVTIACDVTNPLCGPNGASYVYGPQKGATYEVAHELDGILAGFSQFLERVYTERGGHSEQPLAERPGTGAAGGLAAGLISFFPSARIRSGIGIVLETVGFEIALAEADLVLTGEGKLDNQTLSGKAVSGVLRDAGVAGLPVIAFAGEVEEEAAQKLLARGLQDTVALLPLAESREDSIARAAELLQQAVADWIRAHYPV